MVEYFDGEGAPADYSRMESPTQELELPNLGADRGEKSTLLRACPQCRSPLA